MNPTVPVTLSHTGLAARYLRFYSTCIRNPRTASACLLLLLTLASVLVQAKIETDRFTVTAGSGPVRFDVLANDTLDQNNSNACSFGPLIVGDVTKPELGAAGISGNAILYTPPARVEATVVDTFIYQVNASDDGSVEVCGTTIVSVTVTPGPGSLPGPGPVTNTGGDTPVAAMVPSASVGRIGSDLPLARVVENLCDLLTFQADPSVFRDDPRINPGQLAPSQADLQADLCAIVNETDVATQLDALQQIAGGQHQHSETLVRFSRTLTASIFDRLSDIRRLYSEFPGGDQSANQSSWRGHATSALIYLSRPLGVGQGVGPGVAGGGAAGDGDIAGSRWGVFISGSTTSGDGDEASAGFGFDYSAYEFTVGADYLMPRGADAAVAGVALSVGQSEADTDGGRGGVDTDTVGVSLYGSWFRADGWFLEGVVGFTRHDFSSTRVLDYTASNRPVRQSIRGDTDGDELYLGLGGGKDINLGRGYTLSGSGKLNYVDGSVDGVSERLGSGDGFGLALETSNIDVQSFRSELDLQLNKAFSTGFGVLLPYLGTTWIHEFEDRGDDIAARFLVDPFSSDFGQTGFDDTPGGANRPTIFVIPGDENDSDYFRVSAGSSAQFAGGKSAWVSVTGIVGLDDIDSLSLNLGFRWELP